MIWPEVTPWSVLPAALPPWQTPVRLPKLAPDADVDAEAEVDAELDACVLLDPARLQPAVSSPATTMAARALLGILTGFLLGDGPHAGQVVELCEGRHTEIVARILPIENDVSA